MKKTGRVTRGQRSRSILAPPRRLRLFLTKRRKRCKNCGRMTVFRNTPCGWCLQ